MKEYELLKSEGEIYKYEVVAEPKDSLERALNNGYLFKIKIDDRLAGIIAAEKRNMKYFFGYYVIEEILFKNFRGKNFGAAVQRKLIDSIKARDDDFIYGTISTLNAASLRTAIKCGRIIGGSDYFINFKYNNHE